jgi:ATP phosphoribosyltransferase
MTAPETGHSQGKPAECHHRPVQTIRLDHQCQRPQLFPRNQRHTIECAICRAQEMSRYVENGTLDAGLTGKDWIAENARMFMWSRSGLFQGQRPSGPLGAGRALRFDIKTIEDLQGKKIATELVAFTRALFQERGISVNIEFSWGATEAKVVSGLADAIVEVTETGEHHQGPRASHHPRTHADQHPVDCQPHGMGKSAQTGEDRADRPAAQRRPAGEKLVGSR